MVSRSHRQCLFPTSYLRQYRQRIGRETGSSEPTDRSDELKVREFEQRGKEVVEIKPNAELEEVGVALKAKINELERELNILKEGPLGPNSDFMKSFSPEDRAKALEALEEEDLRDDDMDDLIGIEALDRMVECFRDTPQKAEDLPTFPAVTTQIPAQQQAFIKRFNRSLAEMARDKYDHQKSLVLWKWYLRCQHHVPGFSNLVSEDVWQVLWQSRFNLASQSKHLAILGKDMTSVQMPLTASQWITYMESLLLDRDFATAVTLWEGKQGELGPDPTVASSFWSLGVRLYVELGRPSRAQAIAFDCLDHGGFVGPQILLPVIISWAESRHPSAQQRAWTCYLRMRSEAGDEMTPADFEKVSTALLKADKADLALAVFKDMVLAQEQSSADSTVVYQKALDYVTDLQTRAISEENINRISLAALIVLPKSIQNKFFYASWIKKLIGAGEVDAAALVVELMYERGAKLDAKHLNGIIGAWLREGSTVSRNRAEQMAWAMIDERVNLVRRRQREATSMPAHKNIEEIRPIRIPSFVRRVVPPANLETFSILLLHYTGRSQEDLAERVTDALTGPADLRPNSFIMNHWLYATLKVSDIQGVWEKYEALSPSIRPDLETFACLWDTGKIQYDQSKAAHASNFPSARRLYAEMLKWFSNLPSRNVKRAKDLFSRELYDQIVRCFCLSYDLHGTLCALHGLKDLFGEYPDGDTTRMIVISISRRLPADPEHHPSGRRAMRRRVSHSKDAIAKVREILETVADQKAGQLIEQGVNLDEMADADIRENQLRILSEFIVTILNKLKSATGNVQNEVKLAAKVMGADVGAVDFESMKAES